MHPADSSKIILSAIDSHIPVCTTPTRKIEKIDERNDKPSLRNIKNMTSELKESKIIQYFQQPSQSFPPSCASGRETKGGRALAKEKTISQTKSLPL